MTTFDLENPQPLRGDGLRDEAANLLAARYGGAQVERLIDGKKVDVFLEYSDWDRKKKLFVEAKDYQSPLTRKQVVNIWTDYSGLVTKYQPAELLIITRNGLAPGARSFIDDELAFVRHQSIWELETKVLGLTDYLRHAAEIFEEDGLSSYYIEARARLAGYSESLAKRQLEGDDLDLFAEVMAWAENDDSTPIAILGGYGAGKTCFANRIVSHQAARALTDPLARRPILIRLGAFSRYSNLQGIFGGMFSAEFPNSGFNFRQFMAANERGRLLLVFDGFDEMKHAMTWADFRSQVAELNRLMDARSKVLLLGRPSAFLSHEEHVHVLRGRKRIGELWQRIPDWPEFREYDLQEFSKEERASFVRKYLSRVKGRRKSWLQANEIEQRVAKVNELADLALDVFAKPVHAKILTDLGADPDFDLSYFEKGVSRWKLYEAFFTYLTERETEKEARRPIGEQARLRFIRDLAYWLWTEQAGTTAFATGDIPPALLGRLPGLDFPDDESKLREYLTGSFLEKKSGDIFYFAHRSFAEFLVAQRMILTPPAENEHHVYSALFRDGVEDFILEGAEPHSLLNWLPSLSKARGGIRLEYFLTLAGRVGGIRKMRGEMRPGLWRSVLDHFPDRMEFGPLLEQSVIKAMRRSPDPEYAAILIKLVNESLSRRLLDMNSVDAYTLEILAKSLRGNPFAKDIVTQKWKSRTIVVKGRALVEMAEARLRLAGVNLVLEPVRAGIPEEYSVDGGLRGGITILRQDWIESSPRGNKSGKEVELETAESRAART